MLSLIDVTCRVLGKGHCLNVGSAKALFTIRCPYRTTSHKADRHNLPSDVVLQAQRMAGVSAPSLKSAGEAIGLANRKSRVSMICNAITGNPNQLIVISTEKVLGLSSRSRRDLIGPLRPLGSRDVEPAHLVLQGGAL